MSGEEKPSYLRADKGYASHASRTTQMDAGVRSGTSPKRKRKVSIRGNWHHYRQWSSIEPMIGHLRVNRAAPAPEADRIMVSRKCLCMNSWVLWDGALS